MKRDILSRYERDADGRVIIDVSANRVEDLYNNFDKSAPYIRRDLDQDLADYLIACARELEGEPVIIQFTLACQLDPQQRSRIQGSLNSYFGYLAELEHESILKMFRRSAIFFVIGLVILFASVSLNQFLGHQRSVTANVFAEGLTVAAWVSLWEALAVFLVEWFPRRRNVALYRRLAGSQTVFHGRTNSHNESSHLNRLP
ncbi:MAG: hypothetical protein R3292_09385 [Alcanivorax sp.]|nr:hypothetical protein [Alcanivorax sp.]